MGPEPISRILLRSVYLGIGAGRLPDVTETSNAYGRSGPRLSKRPGSDGASRLSREKRAVGGGKREVRVSRTLNAKRPLGLQTLFDLNDARERVDEVLKSTSRKHDGVPTPTNIFRDFQKPSAFVLFEIEKEDLAINLNLLGCERFIYLVWCVVINHDLPFLLSP